MTSVAQADCQLAGKWHMYNFADAGGMAAAVNSCDITIAANGTIRGTCQGYPLGTTSPSTAVSGKFTVNAKCALSGSYTPVGFDTTTLRTGHVNGDFGVALGTRGAPNAPNNVRLINLIRD
jgi:hypothetical protein